MPPPDSASDLRAFIDASPSPVHTVIEVVRRLDAAGFSRVAESDRWSLAPGDQRYLVRDGSSLVAFRVGSAAPSDAGLRLVGAHTDSPTLKIRPRPDVARAGYRTLGAETYGGLLLHTWLDRELTVAGRLAVRSPGHDVELHPVVLPGGPVRLPSLAIHLDRSIREDGLKLNPQLHGQPVWGPWSDSEPLLVQALASVAGVPAGDVVGHDLVLADTQPAAVTGSLGEWVAAPRLDNLGSCHAALCALTAASPAAHTQVIILNDHEEVGSSSAEGAAGTLLADVVARLCAATGDLDPQARLQAAARSLLVSADMAHAVHPNFSDRHEPSHWPRLGGGPVLKVNANQSYATDAGTGGWFTARCHDAVVPLQHFVSRADLPCGSTIGPLSATRTGIATVDVGSPMLAMHSCRELAGVEDVPLMISALTACLSLG